MSASFSKASENKEPTMSAYRMSQNERLAELPRFCSPSHENEVELPGQITQTTQIIPTMAKAVNGSPNAPLISPLFLAPVAEASTSYLKGNISRPKIYNIPVHVTPHLPKRKSTHRNLNNIIHVVITKTVSPYRLSGDRAKKTSLPKILLLNARSLLPKLD